MRLEQPPLVGCELFDAGNPRGSDATRRSVGSRRARGATDKTRSARRMCRTVDGARGSRDSAPEDRCPTEAPPTRARGTARGRADLRPAAGVRGAGERRRPLHLRGGRARPRGLVGELGGEARLGRALEPGARVERALGEVVRRRQAERLAQLPRPPRRRRARRPRRLSLGGRGRRAAHDHLRGPARDDEAVRQRAEGTRRRARRPRRDLPADGPRGRRGDARLRADRRAPFRRLRRLLGGGGQGPHQRLRGEGAGHGRLLAASRKAAADEGVDRRGPGRMPVDRARRRRATDRRGDPVDRGPRRLVARAGRSRLDGLPRRAVRLRADALPALHLRHHGEAEGHRPHQRRLPDRRRRDAQPGVRHQARDRRLLVLGRHRLGHRAQLHRLRAARERLHVDPVRGRARLPRQGPLVGHRRALPVHDLLHRPDRDPRVPQVGPRVPRPPRPLVPAAARAASASRSTRAPGSGTTR